MFIHHLIACLIASLVIQQFGPASALPTTTVSQSPLTESSYRYDIRLCNSTQRDSLAEALDAALKDALNSWHGAASRNHINEPFFKNVQPPVLDTLSKAASYEAIPARGSDIRWACVIPEFLHYFPRANSDLFKACESGEIAGYTIVDSFILVCPQIFDAPAEPLPPQPDVCPPVSDNKFSDEVALPVYRSDIVLQGLIDYALPVHLERTNALTFDDVFNFDTYSSYLSTRNYQLYSIMIKNNCTQVPDIRSPPWDPTLLMGNTTIPLPEDPSRTSPPDAYGTEVPVNELRDTLRLRLLNGELT
ncbi:MAG: hypothetical protein Q9201_006791 [Fulgogasparrea decipioides]